MRPLTKISLFGVRFATCVLVIYWLMLFTGTHLPALPKMPARVTDKTLHSVAFFGLTILLCWVVQTRDHVWRKFAWVAMIAISYAAFDEITQSFVRGRTTDVKDFVADTLGILAAISVYATLRRLLPQWATPAARFEQVPRSDAQPHSERGAHCASRPRATSLDHDSINVA